MGYVIYIMTVCSCGVEVNQCRCCCLFIFVRFFYTLDMKKEGEGVVGHSIVLLQKLHSQGNIFYSFLYH